MSLLGTLVPADTSKKAAPADVAATAPEPAMLDWMRQKAMRAPCALVQEAKIGGAALRSSLHFAVEQVSARRGQDRTAVARRGRLSTSPLAAALGPV